MEMCVEMEELGQINQPWLLVQCYVFQRCGQGGVVLIRPIYYGQNSVMFLELSQ